MKILSIRQPWAWAIIHAGKDFENRTWPTNYRGPLLIHVGKKIEIDAFETITKMTSFTIPEIKDIQTGGIIGSVDLIDCIYATNELFEKHKWLFGPYGFQLSNPRPLPFVKSKGKLKLFDADESILIKCGLKR